MALAVVPLLTLGACGLLDAPVIHADGPIARTERDLFFLAAGLMLIVIIPVFLLTFWFVRRYRASGGRGRYTPEWDYSPWLDAVVWLVPAVIVAILGYLVWTKTHDLDPYRPIAGTGPPLEVRAVAQDWKWLFIYPEQGIATVNELVFPVGRPLRIVMTSDTVMNAFYVPGLAGQIYAMAGMRTKLNLIADHPSRFTGRNMQYSGAGFPEQHFAVRAVTGARFQAWVARVKGSAKALDAAAYAALAKPSRNVPVTYYSSVASGLFAKIVAKYKRGPGPKRTASKKAR